MNELDEFRVGDHSFYGPNAAKWLTVKTVREVFADFRTDVFWLVIEYTPKKGEPIGPLFEGNNPARKAVGPVWHVLRWDFKKFQDWIHEDQPITKRRSSFELVDLAVARAQSYGGLGAVAGMKPVGIGPWPNRRLALMALADIANRERDEHDRAAEARWEAAAKAADSAP